MKIDKKLNLVVTIGDEGNEIHFHHTPVGYETFKKYHFILGKTFADLFSDNIMLTGAKIAAMHMEEVAIQSGKWDGEEGVKNGFMAECERLTKVLILGEKGWENLPVNVAISRGAIDEIAWEEAKQRIVFFTLICCMISGKMREEPIRVMNDLWGTQTTSLTYMDFANSLPISTETENSPATPL